MRSLLADVVGALRATLRGRGLVAAAIVTFALGVGLNVLTLGLIDKLLFRPLPFTDPDRLVHIHLFTRSDPGLSQAFVPYLMTRALTERKDLFEGIGWAEGSVTETSAVPGRNPLRLTPVTVNTLDILGVTPVLGTAFSPIDADDQRQRVVLLTAEAWQREFGGSESVLGHRWQAEPFTYRIIGVLPPDFILPTSHLLGRFDGIYAFHNALLDKYPRGPMTVGTFARLRPDVSMAAVQTVADQVSEITWEAGVEPTGLQPRRLTVQPLQSGFTVLVRPYLWLVTAAAWTVFGVAVVNLSALLSTWGRWRADDSAVRLALGASPGRLFRVAMLEATLICAIGAAAGWAVYLGTQSVLVRISPSLIRDFAVDGWDARLMVAAIGFTVCGALAGGLFPALAARRISLVQALNARSARTSATSRRITRAALAIEAALGVVVLVGASLTVPSFISILVRSPGFDADGLYAVRVGHVTPPDAGSLPEGEPWRLRTEAVLEVVRSAPGVARVSAAAADAFMTEIDEIGFWSRHGAQGIVLPVAPDYLATLGTSLTAGRDFRPDELRQTARVAVLNETAVRLLWPGESMDSAVGRSIDAAGSRLVVGVHRDVRGEPGMPAPPTVLVPFGSPGFRAVQSSLPILMRMERGRTPDPLHLKALLDGRFGSGNVQVESLAARMEPLLERPRFLAALFGVLGLVTLFLIVVALHAVAAFEVVQRRRETGIRLALGATTLAVRRRILAVTIAPIAMGTAVGLGLALLVLLRVPGIVPPGHTGASALAASAFLVVAVGSIAAWLPTRSIARAEPSAALRIE